MRTEVIVPAVAVGVAVIGLAMWVETPARTTVTPQISKPSASSAMRPAFLRCDQISAITDAAPESIRKTEADLYAAIIRLTGQDPAQHLVVEGVSIPRPRFRLREDNGLLSALPSDLRTRLVQGESDCFRLSPDRFPLGTHMVPLTEIRQGVARGRADWPSFRARFGAEMWFAFSSAVMGPDERDAVVFYERFCDGLCGEGEWVWFQRSSAADPWRVMKRLWSWIS